MGKCCWIVGYVDDYCKIVGCEYFCLFGGVWLWWIEDGVIEYVEVFGCEWFLKEVLNFVCYVF